jgi:hypothetical protein
MDRDSPEWALMTVQLAGASKTLAEAARQLNVPEQAVDCNFGLVPVDESNDLFAVQVRSEAVEAAAGAKPFRGPFSDPRIEPFSMTDED